MQTHAGHKLKSDFRKLGRPASGNKNMTGPNGASDGGADENTSLLAGARSRLGNLGAEVTTNSSGQPYYEDERKWVRYPMITLHKTWQVLTSNYVNVLLVFVPVGIILGALDIDPVAIFCVNFLAIVPLAALLSFATEELSVKLGQTLGGLMNATFGNAVELIVRHLESHIWSSCC